MLKFFRRFGKDTNCYCVSEIIGKSEGRRASYFSKVELSGSLNLLILNLTVSSTAGSSSRPGIFLRHRRWTSKLRPVLVVVSCWLWTRTSVVFFAISSVLFPLDIPSSFVALPPCVLHAQNGLHI